MRLYILFTAEARIIPSYFAVIEIMIHRSTGKLEGVNTEGGFI